jgi:hypothetical protein
MSGFDGRVAFAGWIAAGVGQGFPDLSPDWFAVLILMRSKKVEKMCLRMNQTI